MVTGPFQEDKQPVRSNTLAKLRSLCARIERDLARAEAEPGNWRVYHADARKDLEQLAELVLRLDQANAVSSDGGFECLANPNQRAFLAAYSRCGGINRAARLAGVARAMHYEWLKDPAYQAAFDDAQGQAGDYLEGVAFSRAVEGVPKEVFCQGEVVGYTTEYSDSLLKLLLKGAKPLKYQDRGDLTTQGQGLRIIIDEGSVQAAGELDEQAGVLFLPRMTDEQQREAPRPAPPQQRRGPAPAESYQEPGAPEEYRPDCTGPGRER